MIREQLLESSARPGILRAIPQEHEREGVDFDARYLLEAEDGAIIYMQNRGYRWASAEVMERLRRNEPVPSHEYYMRVTPKFDAPEGPHAWMAQHVFVGTAEKVPHGNRIHYFMVR